ncbi:hypothetical protein IPL68_00935 [Candidatus Saccharibacteria bacterium]|nr:MAG: hypothetical protein IPL68_00935 [Candidatus Saccharibacteria bacterium]
MQKQMVPLLAIQLAMAFITAFVLAHVISAQPNDSAYMLAGWMWFGFVLPTQVSAVVFVAQNPNG